MIFTESDGGGRPSGLHFSYLLPATTVYTQAVAAASHTFQSADIPSAAAVVVHTPSAADYIPFVADTSVADHTAAVAADTAAVGHMIAVAAAEEQNRIRSLIGAERNRCCRVLAVLVELTAYSRTLANEK